MSTAETLEGLLRSFLAHPERSGILVDFDGTLSPVVLDPAEAVPVPGTVEVLGRLSRHYRRVGVISGRPAGYLLDRLGVIDGLVLAGLYGMERAEGGRVRPLPEALRWRQAVASAAAEAARRAPPGVGVEPKGLAVTLHYRRAPGHAGWVEHFAAEQAEALGLVAHPGRRSVELRPPVKADKGSVVAELAEGLGAVCYAGDDTGDLPAFETLARLRARGLVTLAVAADSAESPPQLRAAADVVVDGPAGVLGLLQRLAA